MWSFSNSKTDYDRETWTSLVALQHWHRPLCGTHFHFKANWDRRIAWDRHLRNTRSYEVLDVFVSGWITYRNLLVANSRKSRKNMLVLTLNYFTTTTTTAAAAAASNICSRNKLSHSWIWPSAHKLAVLAHMLHYVLLLGCKSTLHKHGVDNAISVRLKISTQGKQALRFLPLNYADEILHENLS
jgi:hypothetical protein